MAKKSPEPAETKTTVASDSVVVPPKKKNNKTLWIVLGVLLVVFIVIPGILLTVGGAIIKNKLDDPDSGAKLAESLVERASGGQVDIDSEDGNFTVESDNGDSSVGFGSNQKLPEDFPKTVSNYLSEKSIVFVLTSKNEDKQTWTVTTTVDKSFSDASTYFEDKIKEPEYTDVSTYGSNESKSFYGVKDNYGVSVTVLAGTDGGDTNVYYIVSEQ